MGMFSGTDPIEIIGVPDSAAVFLAVLDVAFTSAGWKRNGLITGGRQYLMVSPQVRSWQTPSQIVAKINVWSDGDSQYIGDGYPPPRGGPTAFSVEIIKLQFISGDSRSIEMRLGIADGRTYRIWVNRCQFFIAVPANSTEADPVYGYRSLPLNTCAGGIPHVLDMPPGAQAAFQKITEIWWCNDGLNGGSFRNQLDNWTNTVHYSACINGDINSGWVPGPPSRCLRILTLQPAAWFPPTSGSVPPPISQMATRPLFLDPYLTWGAPDGDGTPVLCSELWDAVVATHAFTLGEDVVDISSIFNLGDDQSPYVGATWRKFTDQSPDATNANYYGARWGSLYLLVGVPTRPPKSQIVANDAY